MANLHDCIQRAIDAKELDTTRGQEIQSQFSQLVERYNQAMPRHQAEATAAEHLKEASRAQQLSRQHKVLSQLQTMVRLKHLVDKADDPAIALRNLVEHSEGSGFEGEGIQALSAALIKSVNSGLNEVLRETGRNVFGNSRNSVMLMDIIRELHLEDTGNAKAKAMAEAVRHQQRRMRQMFNAHGGDIGELADFGVAHSHDAAQLRRTGFERWAQDIALNLDWHRMVDLTTGKPFAAKGAQPDPEAAQRFLKDVYDGIVTKGWDDRDPSMSIGGRAMYNRHAEARVLHFRDGSAWLEYNKAYGTADPFSAMIGGLHARAREIAQMRVLGPNPRMGLEYATQVAQKKAALSGDQKLIDRVDRGGKLAKTMLAHVDGSANQAYHEGWARFFSSTRKVLTSIQLGSAALSSVTDIATISVASKAIGLNPTNVLSQSMRLMTSQATRETAARMGYVADTLADAGSTAARFTGDVIAGEFTERLSGFTMRASGLSYWTDMNRLAFQMEFAGFLAENAPRAFDQIDAPLRQMFEARGITAQDWDLLRDPSTQFRAKNGANFISPFHWLEHQTVLQRTEAEGLSMRLQMLIEEQIELAIPSASIEGRARLIGNSEAGTIFGELLRSGSMYKSFAMSMTLGQIRRFNDQPAVMAKMKYGASIIAGLTLTGAVAIQLKEIAKGNDPRPMTDKKFWAAAGFQGGGLGIFGDFISSETSRAGGGWAETLAGPVVGLGSDVAKIAFSNAARAVNGEKTYLGRDIANFARYNTPVASSFWPTRVAFDRMIADQLQRFLDPEAEAQWRRQMRKREKDYGTSAWWKKGDTTPHRAPDLTNVFGGNQ
ncbi:hypothetical protein [Shimia sp.]|uniref:hypothetical protein n=1 Tax=Shimia sp. TaxID=1954381 RepID=UPI003BA8791F